jgi:hypothetical protein
MVEHQKVYDSNYNSDAIIKLEPKIQDYMLLKLKNDV